MRDETVRDERLKQATIIRNPNGSSVPPLTVLTEATNRLTGAGWEVSILETEGPGHAETLARNAVESGSTVVFACGGDGTANEVANGLAGSNAALALIRGGLTNALADEMDIPEDPADAVGLLALGKHRRIDVGLVNGRRFLLMAGVGLDAGVIKSVSPDAKRTFGKLPFVFRGVQALIRDRATPVDLRIDGEAVDAELFWVSIITPLPWLIRCSGTLRRSASSSTAAIASGPSTEGISILHAPPSGKR